MSDGKLKKLIQAKSASGGISDISRENSLLHIDIDKIRTNKQPRQYFNEDDLTGMAETIKEVGILQPLIVSLDGKYADLVAGERRFRAAKMAGLTKVPCVENNRDGYLLAVIENVQRKDLTAIEEAEAYNHLIDKFGFTTETLTGFVGKKRSTITEILSINKLPAEIKDACRSSDKYTKNFLIQIVKAGNEEEMIRAFTKADGRGKTGEDLKNERKMKLSGSSPLQKAKAKITGITKYTQRMQKKLSDTEKIEFKAVVQKLIADLANLIAEAE